METIAEYVKVDNSDFKKQIGDLKKEARSLGTIGKEFSKAAAFLTKAVVAPITSLSAMGVKKYLETTDVGATALKESLKDLSNSWDQMLARVGKAVYQHGELGKKIKELKDWLDGIDAKKIKDMLKIAQWTAILATAAKITSEIIKWRVEYLKLQAAMGTLGVLQIGTTAAANAGTGIAAGATAGAGVPLSVKAIEMLSKSETGRNIINTVKAQELLSAQMAKATAEGVKVAGSWSQIAAKFKPIMGILGKVAGYFALFTVALDALLGVINRYKDADKQIAKLGSTMWALGKVKDIVVIVGSLFEVSAKAVQMMMDAYLSWGMTAYNLFTGQFKSKWAQFRSEWSKTWAEIFTDLWESIKSLFGRGKESNGDKFTFKDKAKPQIVSFEDLNKSAQGWESAMVNEQKKTNEYLKTMSEAARAKSGKTSGKGQTASVFGADYSMMLA